MSPFSLFLTPLSILLSLSTATGVVVHDTKIDRAAMVALSVPSAVASAQSNSKLVNFATDSHTHSERHSLSQSINEKGDAPRVNPRSNAEKKYISQKNLGLGHDPFDVYSLPLA